MRTASTSACARAVSGFGSGSGSGVRKPNMMLIPVACPAGGPDRQERLPRRHPAADHRRLRRRQRQPPPHLEDRAGRPGRRDRPRHQRVPPTPRNAEVEEIEHRLFAQITMNLACRALESHQTILNLIGSTTTTTGLAVTAKLDTGDYSTGIRITDREVKTLSLIHISEPTRRTPISYAVF